MNNKGKKDIHQKFADAVRPWVKERFGPAAEPCGHTEEISQVRIRQGTRLNVKSGNRARLVLTIHLNEPGRPVGFFEGEDQDQAAIQKDDVIQITHEGPAEFIGAFFQVSEAHSWGVRAFSVTAKRYLRLETGQFERVGPAPLQTPQDEPESHDTEPMDHHLVNGEVVHATELAKPRIETAPMPHAVQRPDDTPEKKR